MTTRVSVKPLAGEYAGRGIAALDSDVVAELGLDGAGVVYVAGDGGRIPVRARRANLGDTDQAIIGIDGQTRQAIGVSIGDRATVEPVATSRARSIRVSVPDTDGDVASLLADRLTDRPVTAGQTIPIETNLTGDDEGLPVHVETTDPGGVVVVTDTTEITVAAETLSDDEQADILAGLAVTYEDIGGLEEELDQVRELVELPARFPELFQQVRTQPPAGVLLHGPPGTGKTLIARAVANEVDVHFQTLSGPEIVSKYHGESEEQLREVFQAAEANAPAIIFIDEIDSIAPSRDDASGGVETRIVAQLLSLMDGLGSHGLVTVIGTTNRIDAVDLAVRRAGRFDREIEISAPNREGREEILRIHTRGMPLGEGVDLAAYADRTHGFVGADLENLVREAAMNALRRIRPELDPDADRVEPALLQSITVTDADFTAALREVEPSALREVFVEVPDVGWDDVGGLSAAKEQLQTAVEWPLSYPAAYDRVDLSATTGVLLSGPPGTGKTLLAQALAGESAANFISVKGPELLQKYVGASEAGIRDIFSTARENAPAVIFFDEIDAIALKRGSSEGSPVAERVVSQLLTELDGLEELEAVTVVAATNRPDLLDAALLRAGRLERHIEVPPPDRAAREAILEIHTRDRPLASNIDLGAIAERTDGYVGADIAALCRRAAAAAVREHVADGGDPTALTITAEHFAGALRQVDPSG